MDKQISMLVVPGSRLHDVVVQVSYTFTPHIEQDQADWALCARQPGAFSAGETRKLPCKGPVRGRYVIISIPGKGQILTLCEVQVYAVKGKQW